jgi:hypothetical protein
MSLDIIFNIRWVPCCHTRHKGRSLLKVVYTSDDKEKPIPVTGRGGLKGCETSRLAHFLDSRRMDAVRPALRAGRRPFTPKKIPAFLLEAE